MSDIEFIFRGIEACCQLTIALVDCCSKIDEPNRKIESGQELIDQTKDENSQYPNSIAQPTPEQIKIANSGSEHIEVAKQLDQSMDSQSLISQGSPQTFAPEYAKATPIY